MRHVALQLAEGRGGAGAREAAKNVSNTRRLFERCPLSKCCVVVVIIIIIIVFTFLPNQGCERMARGVGGGILYSSLGRAGSW